MQCENFIRDRGMELEIPFYDILAKQGCMRNIFNAMQCKKMNGWFAYRFSKCTRIFLLLLQELKK